MATTRNAPSPLGGHAPRRSRNRRIDLEWHRHLSHHVGLEGRIGRRRTSPEELIAAAHASCFSMALSHGLATSGNPAISLNTSVESTFSQASGITEIRITLSGEAENLDAEGFKAAAEDARPTARSPRPSPRCRSR